MKKTIKESSTFPISSATIADDIVYVSGQIGMDFKVGDMVDGGVKAETLQALKNLETVLIEAGTTKSQVLKTTVFLTDFNDYQAINQIYKEFFESGFPARSAVGVASLPRDAKVEIECIATIPTP